MPATIPSTTDQWGNSEEALLEALGSLSQDFKNEVSTFVAQRLGTRQVLLGGFHEAEWPLVVAQMSRLTMAWAVASGFVTLDESVKAKDGEVVEDDTGLVTSSTSNPGHYL